MMQKQENINLFLLELYVGHDHRSYKDYISQQNKLLYENFFWNDPDSDCGVPIILSPDYQMVVPGLTKIFRTYSRYYGNGIHG